MTFFFLFAKLQISGFLPKLHLHGQQKDIHLFDFLNYFAKIFILPLNKIIKFDAFIVIYLK